MTDALIAELRELSPSQFANVVQTALAGRVSDGRASEVGSLIVAVLTEDVTVEAHAGSPVNARTHLEDELRRAVIRSGAHRAVLAEDLLDSRAVAQALGRTGQNSREAASTLRRAGRLVGIPYQHQYLYPAFQFDPVARCLRAVVSQVNHELGAADDPWGVASWWVGSNSRLGGRSPKDLLGTPGERDLITLAAAETGE
ncbi:hypothetical protein ACFP6A_09840 [Quadrisphaera sp. GCM10027208]|uniref:hypothetical protein n=1 Tax=Quadrisphaera sp. GCM10027208 TaxID=3273423 RepID=UPI00360DB777